MSTLPRGSTIRRDAGLYGYERALRRAGLSPVAGVDEAGRGACAGPLVAAAAILPEGRAGLVPELADSKLLTARARERCYAQVTRRALAWSVVVVEPDECDRLGMHVANVAALRRALARLDVRPAYVLTDGFPVDGLGVPGLAMWKGDRVAACISAASVIAKVTRDRLMLQLHERWPEYDFATHKGYITEEHTEALDEHGPCPIHRMRFVNVRRAAGILDEEPISLEPQLELDLVGGRAANDESGQLVGGRAANDENGQLVGGRAANEVSGQSRPHDQEEPR
jgi:ribonuclease HII